MTETVPAYRVGAFRDQCDAARFWRRVQKGGPDDCWPWLGPLDKAGRGKISIGYQDLRPHQLAWLLAYGERPLGHGVNLHHRCRMPSCCNVAHLRVMTRADHKRIHNWERHPS